MNDTKIIKKIDELGRLGIPKHIRHAMGIGPEEAVELILDGSTLIIKKINERCEFCGRGEELSEFKGKFICNACRDELNAEQTVK